jgi:hypothetical protein
MVTLTAVVLPRFSTTTRAETVERAGETAAEVIRFARHEAVRRGVTVRALFEDEGNVIQLRVQDPASLGTLEMAESEDGFFETGIRLPDGVRIRHIVREGQSELAGQLDFGPDGTGDPVELTLSAYGAEAGKITLGVLYDQVTFERLSK